MTKNIWCIIDRHEDANVLISLEKFPQDSGFVLYALDKLSGQVGGFAKGKTLKPLRKNFDNYVALALEYENHLKDSK